MGLSIDLVGEGEASHLVEQSVLAIMDSTRLLTLATVTPEGHPSACNALFAYDSYCRLYILTPPSTEHAFNVERNGWAAVTIADSQQTGDGGKRGLQIKASARRAEGEELREGLAAYRDRYPGTRDALASEEALEESGWESRIYVIIPETIKVFDERVFGEEKWISVTPRNREALVRDFGDNH
jgi:uncharacterized protein YhbP (UPF0306 family)